MKTRLMIRNRTLKTLFYTNLLTSKKDMRYRFDILDIVLECLGDAIHILSEVDATGNSDPCIGRKTGFDGVERSACGATDLRPGILAGIFDELIDQRPSGDT